MRKQCESGYENLSLKDVERICDRKADKKDFLRGLEMNAVAVKTDKFRGGVRSSNIELFRILSMLMIVAHHYVVNSGLMSCIDAQNVLHFQDYFLLLFGWGGKTGINCFVLITGYFMCTSAITKKKFFKLLGERYFYAVAIWCLFFFTGYEAFSVKGFLKMMFPFFTVADNFTSCFLLFYLLIPFLNKLIHALTEKEHFMLMAWCIGVYVFLPSFAKANVVFNYITWFSILYVIASYIRLHPKDWLNSTKITGSLAGASLLLSWMSVIVLAIVSRFIGKEIGICYYFVADSNKVLALITGVSTFLFFKNLKIGYSKAINTIAASTFGVLLIHANSDTMRRWLWGDVCNNVGAYQEGNIIIHAIASVMVIYFVCTIIDMIRNRLIEQPLIKRS